MSRVVDSVECTRKASTHLVKRSVTAKIYLWPFDDADSRPVLSHDSFWNGYSAWIVPKGACNFCGGLLQRWQV